MTAPTPEDLFGNLPILDDLPTPLVRAVAQLRQEDSTKRPFRAVHRLIDTLEVLCKMYTVAGLACFIEALGEHLKEVGQSDAAHARTLDGLKTSLSAGLRKPSLGIWWGFARETAALLEAVAAEHVLPGAARTLAKKGDMFKAYEGKHNLITFRNSYAHGATPTDKRCRADLKTVGPRVRRLLEGATPLTGVTLAVVGEGGALRAARGAELRPWQGPQPEGLVPGHCVLMREGRAPLDLHPLLTFRADVGEAGAFFFYNDLKKNAASMLNYPWSLHHREGALRDELLARFPLEEWKRLGGADLDPFRERIASLTEVFKGRTVELSALARFLTETDRGFHVVWGPPGVGKSTLLARMVELLRWSPELREQASPGIDWPALDITVFEYFIRRGATDTATALLDSLNKRLDMRFGMKHPLGSTDPERVEQFRLRLKAISMRLKPHQRLVLVLDGLDEARHDDPLLSSLPRDVPAGVVVLYGARPQKSLRYGFYEELDRERRSCVDLEGLTLEDTRALLYEHVDKYALEADYAKAVLERSEGNPLYLKLLCQGLEQQVYQLNDSDKLPKGEKKMDELYTSLLVRIHDVAPDATRVLTLLAAARDFVSPAMMAELMKQSESQVTHGPLAACMELLYENPLTEDLEDYQLFHESLREHLCGRYAAEVNAWEEKLADWATAWKTQAGDPMHRAEREGYAMAWAVPHQEACRARAAKAGRTDERTRRGDAMLALVEDASWRERCFLVCGHGAPLQRAIRGAQRVVRHRDAAGSERMRMLTFARWLHDEPDRLYRAQRDKLRAAVPRARQASWLGDVVQLARMGARPRDRVMLALTALWASPHGRPSERPPVLDKAVVRWLEEAREPALDKLWQLTGGTV